MTPYSISSREFGCIWLNLSTQNAPVYQKYVPEVDLCAICPNNLYVFKQVSLHSFNFFMKGGSKVRCTRTYTHGKEKMLNMYLKQQLECSGNNHNSLVCLMFYSDNCSAV